MHGIVCVCLHLNLRKSFYLLRQRRSHENHYNFLTVILQFVIFLTFISMLPRSIIGNRK